MSTLKEYALVIFVVSLVLFVAALVVLSYVGFWLVVETDQGIIDDKWVETYESCDDGDCTTTTYYYVRLQDGRVFFIYHGYEPFSRIREGRAIAYTARGFRFEIYGLRVFVPHITNFEFIETPRPQ